MFIRYGRRLFMLVMAGLFFVPLSSYASDSSQETPRLPLAMEVFLKKPNERIYNLHIHLTNMSKESVKVDLHDLPWNPPNDAKWLSARQISGARTLLTQQVHRWEIGSQEVPLQPGESIQGKILLNPRLPTLLDDIKDFGVQLRWNCPPEALKFVCKDRTSQVIVIPKGDRGHPDRYAVDKDGCRRSAESIHLIKIPKNDDVLFLYMPEAEMEDLSYVRFLLRRVAQYVRQCQPKWTNSWSASFFSDEKNAGFLRDVENEHLFKEGSWQESNIGQYSSQTRTLFRFPWIKKKADEVYLSVYQ